MEGIDIDHILGRDQIKNKIKAQLAVCQADPNNVLIKRGFYIYGETGIGKTHFVRSLVKELGYEIISFDGSTSRNKKVMETLNTKHTNHMSVLSMFSKKRREKVIVMDEIDGMSGSDKSGISTLISMIRPKKTKKQKTEDRTLIPVFCIGNTCIDKKIGELIKVTNVYPLSRPTYDQMKTLLRKLMVYDEALEADMIHFVNGDIRNVKFLYNLYKKDYELFKKKHIVNQMCHKITNDYTKDVCRKLLMNKYDIDQHDDTIHETDRTTVGLLFHENVIDALAHYKKPKEYLDKYLSMLDHFCEADYIDRITFQKQIWIFNDITSMMKTMQGNAILHETTSNSPKKPFYPKEIRFTKILTKYSTEYNNTLFLQELVKKCDMEVGDIISLFYSQRKEFRKKGLLSFVEDKQVTELDVARLFRYIENMTPWMNEPTPVSSSDSTPLIQAKSKLT